MEAARMSIYMILQGGGSRPGSRATTMVMKVEFTGVPNNLGSARATARPISIIRIGPGQSVHEPIASAQRPRFMHLLSMAMIPTPSISKTQIVVTTRITPFTQDSITTPEAGHYGPALHTCLVLRSRQKGGFIPGGFTESRYTKLLQSEIN